MKKIQIIKILASFFIIIVVIQTNSFARYYESLNKITGKATIAEPIIKVENLQETIIENINKNSKEKEYYFNVKNYLINEKNNKKITEVDFDFFIEIKNSDTNFPIKYKLIDCENSEELLNNKSITSKIHINRNVEFNKTYKLVIEWDDRENIQSVTDNIDIVVSVSQSNI